MKRWRGRRISWRVDQRASPSRAARLRAPRLGSSGARPVLRLRAARSAVADRRRFADVDRRPACWNARGYNRASRDLFTVLLGSSERGSPDPLSAQSAPERGGVNDAASRGVDHASTPTVWIRAAMIADLRERQHRAPARSHAERVWRPALRRSEGSRGAFCEESPIPDRSGSGRGCRLRSVRRPPHGVRAAGQQPRRLPSTAAAPRRSCCRAAR